MRETTKETTIFPINLILDIFNTESEREIKSKLKILCGK